MPTTLIYLGSEYFRKEMRFECSKKDSPLERVNMVFPGPLHL